MTPGAAARRPGRAARESSAIIVAAWLLAACASGAGAPAAAPAGSAAALSRPRPYPVPESPAFARAVEHGTRTRTGRPGPRHWTQRAAYRLEATLDPATRRVSGRGALRYENRSPDTLAAVHLHLHQNLFRPDAPRTEPVPPTGGMEITRVIAQGRALARAPRLEDAATGAASAYAIDGTILSLRLPRPIAPGTTADFEVAWSFVLPPDGAPREGTDGSAYVVAYWYPQFAVYDDVEGWQLDPYLGNAEFYMGWADYDVALTVPEGWLVGATGELSNADEVLTPRTRERLAQARAVEASGDARADTTTRGIVHVVRDDERGAGAATVRGQGGRLTWRFRATNVRDFMWGTSAEYLWDATTARAGARGDAGGGRVLVHALYRPDRTSWAWDQAARYGRHSLEFLSRFLWPYPYPQMTALDGVTSCAGMEYPMVTCIGGPRDTLSLYSVIVHEFGHMWFPMQVGSDEKRHAWQDEGLTRFNQAQAMREFFGGYDLESRVRDAYLGLARADGEVELMRHGDRYPVASPAYGVQTYQKMSTVLSMLRALLGEETFLRAYREYGRRWIGRHPAPLDLWRTFEDVAQRDLWWFWRSWFFETWTLDHAIAGVAVRGGEAAITVEDRGLAPMPARLVVRRADGSATRLEVPVEIWLGGARRHVLRVAASPAIREVELDPDHAFADIDRGNDRWTP